MKDSIGSISRRSFELKFLHHQRGRSSGMVLDETQLRAEIPQEHRCWANSPPQLLRDVIQRVEVSESVWPSRKHVVACGAVRSTRREITKELLKTPEQSGRLTFPISLKQVLYTLPFLQPILHYLRIKLRVVQKLRCPTL